MNMEMHMDVSMMDESLSNNRGDVVIYDGHCALCCRWVERLRRWDRSQRLSFLSLHDPEVARRFPTLARDELMLELHVVNRHGRRYRGARAIRYLSLRLPYLSWLAPILHLPFSLALWNWLYRKIADSRYGPSDLETCTTNCDSSKCDQVGLRL